MNVIQSPPGVSNNYLTYHTERSHPSNYSEQSHYSSDSPTSHSSNLHYNSSNSGQNYGQPVNQYNEMYDTCSPYAANIPPAIRQPIPSSNLKYWNSDQMSHNSHNNYNQGIPPPPLMSRNQTLGSPPLRSPHRNTGNSYSGPPVQHRSSSQSPQEWSRSSNVMSSPATTPSPLSQHQTVSRSPSHMSSVVSQQFSPSHSSHSFNDTQQSAQKGETGIASTNQNDNSSHGSASNPLQSLQKMVMTESDNTTELRNTYNNNNGSVDMNPNTIPKNFNNDSNVNNGPDSPYPTYYNLDQNRLCTPPHPSPNLNSTDIPDESKEMSSDRQLSESDIELKKCETNETKSSNSDSDLIYSNLGESKAETINQINARVNHINDTSVGINGEIPLTKMKASLPNSEVSSDLSQEVMSEHMTPPVVNKRTESRDSLQSSDSETAQSAYGEGRGPHIWQMEKEYYNRYSDQKNNWSQQWPHNNLGQTSRPQPLPQNNYMPSGGRPVPPPLNCMPYQTPYGSGSWAPSVSSSQSSTPVQEFAPPNNVKPDSGKKKRGRPFGSKNRRNSDDNNESNPSDTSSSSKKTKKVMTQEIGTNTSVSIDSHGFDELAVVNPLKHSSKRKKTIGPFIRMEKSRGRAITRYAIVNTSTKPEDEKDIKTKSISVKTEPIPHIRRPSLLATAKKGLSTLASQYDLSLSDKSWVCALCHKGPHYRGLGDLFGPYFISTDDKSKNQTTCPSSADQPSTSRTQSCLYDSYDRTIDAVIASEMKTEKSEKRGRRRKSENSEETNKGRLKQSPKTVSIQNSENETTASHSSNTEVWVHEDCIVWSNGVYLIGHRVKNLEEVITESNENVILGSFFEFLRFYPIFL